MGFLSRFLVEAFAAIVGDGRVVTWGHPNSGGVCGLTRRLFPGPPRGFGCLGHREKTPPLLQFRWVKVGS